MSLSKEYTIGGVKICFPCKAYASQLSMMHSIISGLNNGQHCLLESPTGTGKSLALLCSSLAWQKAYCDKKAQEASDKKGVIDLTLSPDKKDVTEKPSQTVSKPEEFKPKEQPDEMDGDFRPSKKRIRSQAGDRVANGNGCGVIFEEEPVVRSVQPSCSDKKCTGTPNAKAASTSSQFCRVEEETSTKEHGKQKIPKIFYCTRTHKQITQIVHELKRTMYTSTPMTILSSRSHSCVNPAVVQHKNCNERCKELLEGMNGLSCKFYHQVHKMRDQKTLQGVHGLQMAWDIEDLVDLGSRLRSCAYYAARELMQQANIVFCPYNYVLDPIIRENMEIKLKGQVVILDEAHNIEDAARECTSYVLDFNSLLEAQRELEELITIKVRTSCHERLLAFTCSLMNWMKDEGHSLKHSDFERVGAEWSGKDILNKFHGLGITRDTFASLQKTLATVLEKEQYVQLAGNKEILMPVCTISSSIASMFKSIFMILDFLFQDNCRFAGDYIVSLAQEYVWKNKLHMSQGNKAKILVSTLSFFCLNPAVAFSSLSNSVHSIVLTSGTLSPMRPFSSELGVIFSNRLEANHVIKPQQVWVGTVGKGPSGKRLVATFRNVVTYEFQDELGNLLLQVCSSVPKGVLCFLPTYRLVEKLHDRWNTTGLYENLQRTKTVFEESRNSDTFDDMLQSYYRAVKEPGDKDGALLIAVYRGKVSEGMDFTDDNARAVISIGIPYPNITDAKVISKMKYNDKHSKTKGLLTGREWYESQAFRALNQSLGRCIRHKNDWGALILVDDRFSFQPQKITSGLSKWVRGFAENYTSFDGAMQSLKAFFKGQQVAVVDREPCQNVPARTSLAPLSIVTKEKAPLYFSSPGYLPRLSGCQMPALEVQEVSVTSSDDISNHDEQKGDSDFQNKKRPRLGDVSYDSDNEANGKVPSVYRATPPDVFSESLSSDAEGSEYSHRILEDNQQKSSRSKMFETGGKAQDSDDCVTEHSSRY